MEKKKTGVKRDAMSSEPSGADSNVSSFRTFYFLFLFPVRQKGENDC